MKEVELSKGKVALVDDDSFDLVTGYTWHCSHIHGKDIHYAKTNIRVGDRQKQIWMHRLILGCPSNKEVDHIDSNGLNNQKSNLRIATHQQNLFNQRKRSGGTSQYKGVCWCKRSERWLAQLVINRKNKVLGYFDDEISAAVAYDTAAMFYFGEFARKNFSDSVNLALVKVTEDFDILGV
jgi:hypothetical protein